MFERNTRVLVCNPSLTNLIKGYGQVLQCKELNVLLRGTFLSDDRKLRVILTIQTSLKA